MKERPIIFNAHDVRAILEGRKTQTRRIVKLPHDADVIVQNGKVWKPARVDYEGYVECPFGQPGDRLWVRENFYQDGQWCCRIGYDPNERGSTFWSGSSRVLYPATMTGELPPPMDSMNTWRSRPSIHMSRWASRITLEVTGVRVERLQDISEADAAAEGATGDCPIGNLNAYNEAPMIYHFAQMWDAINKSDQWAENPWVWVIEFRRIEPLNPSSTLDE